MRDPVDVVRRFNRSYTQRIGVLDDSFLGLGMPLGPVRLLFEIGAAPATAQALRDRLGLDSGYLSRLLRSLESAPRRKQLETFFSFDIPCVFITKAQEPLPDLIAYAPERFQSTVFRSFGGIIKSPMDGLSARKYRTLLFGAIADGDHIVELVVGIYLQVFRLLLRHVDA